MSQRLTVLAFALFLPLTVSAAEMPCMIGNRAPEAAAGEVATKCSIAQRDEWFRQAITRMLDDSPNH